jgi:hypothetical protein
VLDGVILQVRILDHNEVTRRLLNPPGDCAPSPGSVVGVGSDPDCCFQFNKNFARAILGAFVYAQNLNLQWDSNTRSTIWRSVARSS